MTIRTCTSKPCQAEALPLCARFCRRCILLFTDDAFLGFLFAELRDLGHFEGDWDELRKSRLGVLAELVDARRATTPLAAESEILEDPSVAEPN